MKFLIESNQKTGKGTKQVANINQRKNPSSNCFYNIMNPSNKIQCDLCKRDITKYTKILANDCDYCIGCFSNLDKSPEIYHVINKIDYPIFDVEWSAEEELLLFEGLEKHGFGNWSEIADFIGTNKTREDVQDHYTSIYIEAADFYPDKHDILTMRDKSNNLVMRNSKEAVITRKNNKAITKSMSFNNHQFRNTDLKLERGSLTVNNQLSNGLKTGTNPAEIVGFMPRRGDFEVDYDNDAELLLAEMEFNDDDSEEERQMKFRLMDIYNHKLTERIRRKEFVISRKLLDLKEQSRLDKARTKEEKEIYNMMKVFSRFNTPEEHDKLVMGIIKEKQIRQRIEELKEYMKKGYRTLAEVEDELQNKRRKEEKGGKKKIESQFGIFEPNTRRISKNRPLEKTEKKSTYPSKQEEQLCHKLHMTTRQYMMIKETILRESIKQGILDKDVTSKIFKIERPIFDGVFDFLVQKEDIIEK